MPPTNTSAEDRNILILTIFAIFAYIGAFGISVTVGFNILAIMMVIIAFAFTGLIIKNIVGSLNR